VTDAFRATFLILVRKAGSLRQRQRLGPSPDSFFVVSFQLQLLRMAFFIDHATWRGLGSRGMVNIRVRKDEVFNESNAKVG
jgi:hypothetical protein